MTGHARLSPSGADRWCVCTASVPLIERLISAGELRESDLEGEGGGSDETITEEEIIDFQIDAYSDVVLDPTRESTSFSAEGTALHSIRADCLEFGFEPMDFVGQTIIADGYSFRIDEDMADRLVPGIDWIRERATAVHVEQRVSLDPWLPGNYGFCDTYWLMNTTAISNTLYVNDYKNGVGEPVQAINNRQLRLYALGAWHELGQPKVEKVIMVIDQPRAGGIKEWEITFDELIAFGEEVKAVYARIERGDVEFVPNHKSCRWCPVRKTKRGCAAYNTWKLWMLGDAVMDISREPRFKDPAQMPRALRFYIVQHAASIRQWLAKLHEESLNAAIEGDPDPGSKAIQGGEGRRYFTDPVKAQHIVEGALGDDAFKPLELIGFTEIDKLMKPGRKKKGHPQAYADLLKLVDRRESKPKLVPADHPAPAYVRKEDEFEDQTDDCDDFDEM